MAGKVRASPPRNDPRKAAKHKGRDPSPGPSPCVPCTAVVPCYSDCDSAIRMAAFAGDTVLPLCALTWLRNAP